MRSMKAIFAIGEKKFGPAEDSNRGYKEISKIIEKYDDKNAHLETEEDSDDDDDDDDEDEDDNPHPGRVLNTSKIMERIFDVDNERILLKFHREKGQIFCKTVEFLSPRKVEDFPGSISAAATSNAAEKPQLTSEDVKVYLVDPREENPSQMELALIYEEQLRLQVSISVNMSTNLFTCNCNSLNK